jgi:hypothetical protein
MLIQAWNDGTEKLTWRRHAAILLPILGIYLALGFYGIDRQSLWEDEYNSLWRVTSSKHPIWRDAHGFLYFALLHLWIKLGTSELMLRALSVVLGGLAVCFMYAMGMVLTKRRLFASVSALLLASSPLFIWYSQEARYITLMIVSTLAMAYTFQRVIVSPAIGWWIAYGAAMLFALFSFVSTLLLPVAHGLYLTWSSRGRPLLRQWLLCTGIAFFIFTIWFIKGTHFVGAIADARQDGQTVLSNPNVFPFSGDFNQVRAAMVPYTVFAFTAGFSLGPSLRDLYSDRSLAPLLPHINAILALFAIYGFLCVSSLRLFRTQRESGAFLIFWLTVPILGVFGIAKILNIFFDIRYVAMALPAYLFIAAAGIINLHKPWIRWLALVVVLGVHLVSLTNYYFEPRYAREDTRAAAEFLRSATRRDDIVLVLGTLSSLPHYYQGGPPLVPFTPSDGKDKPLEARLRQLGEQHDRLWLVQIRPWQIDRSGVVKVELDRTFAMIKQQVFPGVSIHGYQISN